MATIRLEHTVHAPPEVCFDLARSVEHHVASTSGTGERVVGGRLTGLLEQGDTVTWSARAFGVRWQMTACITRAERPRMFVDQQLRGPFASLRHRHDFQAVGGGTRILDCLEVRSPFGPLGQLVDKLIMKRHLQHLLEKRNAYLKAVAEHSSP